ncbi:uncharacterized protein LOC120207461 [Hibiscus syriacus]|uniref:uncharacterized protein LOC120207461 n=1 Tax=Hibiscus syriacus TaxID=106335 RepID=UPI0019228C90|nr:uncharacterized protein LOC120207461 [Hibiscus syriacus]
MRTTLANVWHPIGGIAISELGKGRYLFRLYHVVDVNRIDKEGPWYFNTHLLVLHMLQEKEDLMLVSLNIVDFWVRIVDLPEGFVSERMAKLFGNFISEFLEYDASDVSLGYKGCIHSRVRIDVRQPLKRNKKLALPNRNHVYAAFQYEKLRLFCFICEKSGHGEGFCPIRILYEKQDFVFQWDNSLHAPPRQRGQLYSPG